MPDWGRTRCWGVPLRRLLLWEQVSLVLQLVLPDYEMLNAAPPSRLLPVQPAPYPVLRYLVLPSVIT